MSDYIRYEKALRLIKNWSALGEDYYLESANGAAELDIISPVIDYEDDYLFLKAGEVKTNYYLTDINELNKEEKEDLRNKYVQIKILVKERLSGIESMIDKQDIFSQFEENFRLNKKGDTFFMKKKYS